MNYDPQSELVSMRASIPGGSYAAWGWGDSMKDTEMLVFSADGDASSVETYYSKGKKTPEADASLIECYTWSKTVGEDDWVTFAVTRPLDCGIESSYVIELDAELSLIAAWNPESPQLSYHGESRMEFI